MVKIKLFLGIVLALFSCQESFYLAKQPYQGNNLKLNGYYYSLDNNYVELFFLYKNGVIYRGGSGTVQKENIANNKIKDITQYFYSNTKSKTNWGVFRVSNNNIEYDMRYPRADAPVYRRKGIILNDSTFIIKSYSKPDGKEYHSLDITYHFKQFSPKPDSTNDFIK